MQSTESPAQALALPADHPLREELHNEVHARPSARIRVPALVIHVAVSNKGVDRADEWAHLRRLPGHDDLPQAALDRNFLRLPLDGQLLRWERHSEFTRYTLFQPLPAEAGLDRREPDLLGTMLIDREWLRGIPGRTIAAIQQVFVSQTLEDPDACLARAQQWFGEHPVVASLLGNGHSLAVTDFQLDDSGFERMLVIAPPGTSETRAGRISQRLLELETYRLLALRGLPVAKALGPMITESETALATITGQFAAKQASYQDLLDQLVALASTIESATADHAYRFSATQAYAALVDERIAEMREKAIPGTQRIGEFMRRRLRPAIATVAATAQRLSSLAQRVERSSGLLRTRVDIATEVQNQQLLQKITRGQQMQLRLQTTVEGLSIAAISYYVVSLLYYVSKSAKAIGVPINPEIAAGALIPLVLWATWRTTRRIHARLHSLDGDHAGH
ncbi:DUF3422 family protein [Piscinibacter sakaiensis]|uniref:DUF3422 family protein n=1 Tax=Piscinibacter sakaiensis TaxID=1547922 RepID=UPI003AAA563B